MKNLRLPILLLALLLILSVVCAAPAAAAKTKEKQDPDLPELKMGNEAAAEIEKQIKLVSDPALQARLDAIGAELAVVAGTFQVNATYGNPRLSKFPYTFKIVDDKEINAFALPGGHLYINKALIDFVQSDHELAAVLAHEIAHDAHHHMIYLLKEQSKLNNRMALVLLAAILGNTQSADLGNLVMGAQLIQIAKMSSYGVKAETDADRTAVDYLSKTKYNPVGLLTFIERLSTKTDLFEGQATIIQDHPPTGDRRAVIEARLKDLNIPIARRMVTNAAKAIPRTKQIDGKDVVEIAIDDKLLMRVADGPEGQPAAERAKQIADKVNIFLDSDPLLKDIKTDAKEPIVTARRVPLIRVTAADASLSSKSPAEVADGAAEVIKNVMREQIYTLTSMPTSRDKNLR